MVDKKLLDKILLNRILGVMVFLMIMYVMFIFTTICGGYLQNLFNAISQDLFINLPYRLLHKVNIPEWLQVLIVNGLGCGLHVTITFIPVLVCMFLFLSFLENSGYLARAAFVVDHFMKYLGLPGQSFVAMISGFGCNIPAILSARKLPRKGERILTILMMPFMSCSARLAVYTIFVTVFFPTARQNIIFILYITGILVAILTGLVFKNIILQTQADIASAKIELPEYSLPKVSTLLRATWQQLQGFLLKAGSIIIPMCIIFTMISVITKDELKSTTLETVGKTIVPIFKPMGIQSDNWPAAIGLVTGFISKEVIIGTLSSLYMQEDLVKKERSSDSILLQNNQKLDNSFIGIMHIKFRNPIAAFSYLLFVLLYFPCISAITMIARELNKAWAAFSVVWSTLLAYTIAVIFYQVATFGMHEWSSMIWIIGLLCGFTTIIYWLRRWVR